MAKWFYAMPGRRLMDERLAADFLQQMARRYGVATLVQIAAVPVVIVASRIGISASTTALESLRATFTRITNRRSTRVAIWLVA
ncbi:hypothetical protein [Caballeronia grimmiae]|uniref:hypothetical protein n=1 Tax=Caballeronia grimmiae TaxID=1071679 RepID=UPI001E4C26A3|nr:hypothetical protein [Caballeronia grimmiae]